MVPWFRQLSEFDSVDKLPLDQTNACSNGNVLLTYAKGEKLDKIGFQVFTPDLSLSNSNSPNIKSLFSNKKSYYNGVTVMNKKSYVFVKEVYKETKTEGMSAVEFSQGSLDVTGEPIKLFESSRGVAGYSWSISKDKTKLFYRSNLRNRERKDILNKQEFGFYMFDENMKQIWGGEYEMPYTEAKMDLNFVCFLVIQMMVNYII